MEDPVQLARRLAWERSRAAIAGGQRNRAKTWGGKPSPKQERKSKRWKREA